MDPIKQNQNEAGQELSAGDNSDSGSPIDIEAIMREIRDTIAQKKQKGIYSEEEIEEIAKLKLETFADSAEIDTMLVRYLREENRMWNISSDYRVESHRGKLGGLIVLAKKIVRPLIRLYTDHIVERQAQLNLYIVHILHNLVRELTRLNVENTQLRHRLEVLEHEHRFFQKRERTLEDLVVYRDEQSAGKDDPAKNSP
jgi:hypothetical protein